MPGLRVSGIGPSSSQRRVEAYWASLEALQLAFRCWRADGEIEGRLVCWVGRVVLRSLWMYIKTDVCGTKARFELGSGSNGYWWVILVEASGGKEKVRSSLLFEVLSTRNLPVTDLGANRKID